MNKENEKIDDKNIELLFNTVSKQLYIQLETIDRIDQKAATLFGVDSIVLSLIFTISDKEHDIFFFYIGITLLLASLVLLFFEYLTRTWRIDPEPKKFIDKYYSQSYINTIKQLISNITESYEKNKRFEIYKANLFDLSSACSIAGIIYIFLSVLL